MPTLGGQVKSKSEFEGSCQEPGRTAHFLLRRLSSSLNHHNQRKVCRIMEAFRARVKELQRAVRISTAIQNNSHICRARSKIKECSTSLRRQRIFRSLKELEAKITISSSRCGSLFDSAVFAPLSTNPALTTESGGVETITKIFKIVSIIIPKSRLKNRCVLQENGLR